MAFRRVWRNPRSYPRYGWTAAIFVLFVGVSVASAAWTNRWVLAGPTTIVPAGKPQGAAKFSGAVVAIAVDPRDSNIIYVGTGAGGVWKSIDAGKSWLPLTDHQPFSAIGSLAIDPSNPDIVYAGTGNGFHSGGGVLKSVDAGKTWQLSRGPFAGPVATVQEARLSRYASGGAEILSLAINSADGNVILAAVWPETPRAAHGIYRSSDGGNTWTAVLPIGRAMTVTFHPTDPNIAFAGGVGGVFKSTDKGVTWNAVNGSGATALATSSSADGPPTVFQAVIVTTRPNIMFALSTKDDLYRTTDNGGHWTKLRSPPHDCGRRLLAADPINSNLLFVGGLPSGDDLCRSTDGGSTWQPVKSGPNGVQRHGDLRTVVCKRDGGLLVGDDGGLWSAANRAAKTITWNDLNNGRATAMSYDGCLSVYPNNPRLGIVGLQDNGMVKVASAAVAWPKLDLCGDGGASVFDLKNPANIYVVCTNDGRIYKSNSGGFSWTEKTSGIDPAEFIPTDLALAIDSTNPNRLYFGSTTIYRTDDGANHWRRICSERGAEFKVLKIAPSDPRTVWASRNMANAIWVTRDALSDNPHWERRNAGLPARPITQITITDNDPLTAYVTLSHYATGTDPVGHVFKTTNGGVNWSDISGNLPNEQAYDIVADPDVAGRLYVATEIGVSVTDDDGKSWFPLGRDLPRVPVTTLRFLRQQRILYASTWGRSVWWTIVPVVSQAPRPSAAPIPPHASPGSIASPRPGRSYGTPSNSFDAIQLWPSSPPPRP